MKSNFSERLWDWKLWCLKELEEPLQTVTGISVPQSWPLVIWLALRKEFAFCALVTSLLKQNLSSKELAVKWMPFPAKPSVRLSSTPFIETINPFSVFSWLWTIDLQVKDFLFHCQPSETSRHPSCLMRPCALPFFIAKIAICPFSHLFPSPGLFPWGN